MDSASADLDCIIIGAGLAGAATAAVLGRRGVRAALVDPRRHCGPTFKAEKVEADQAAILRRLGLLEGILPRAARIREVREGHAGEIHNIRRIEQYGIFYQDLVNAVREQVPATVAFHEARATKLEAGERRQTVSLDNGARLSARLLILAAGTAGKVHETLGLARRMVRPAHSLASGFDIERLDGLPFPFEALTYYPDSIASRIDYATLFTMRDRMRVNVFSYRDAKDPWVRALADDPRAVLERDLPGLTRLAGPWRPCGKVESRPIDLFVVAPPLRDGVVLLGDALQSVCPATGTGLSKVLTDVEMLCTEYLPRWLSTPGMERAKLAAFYADPRKADCDSHSLRAAEYGRKLRTSHAIAWGLRRHLAIARLSWSRLRDRVKAG